MGLDMYAFTCPKNETPDRDNCEELFYWRKFKALHGWMEGLWRDRGGTRINLLKLQCLVLLDLNPVSPLPICRISMGWIHSRSMSRSMQPGYTPSW